MLSQSKSKDEEKENTKDFKPSRAWEVKKRSVTKKKKTIFVPGSN